MFISGPTVGMLIGTAYLCWKEGWFSDDWQNKKDDSDEKDNK